MPQSPGFACIVGAPRCGTTSLAGFLQSHPDVCFSVAKEPHYFSQYDLTSLPHNDLRRAVRSDYLDRYFPHRAPEHAMLAEGSVSYLYAPEQMAPILKLWPDARFIIAIRDPMEMLPSLHQRLLVTGDETVADFERAWALIPERSQGRSIPGTCVDPRWLRYEEVARLGHYIERFFKVVGRERCFVSVFDDLKADPAVIYDGMLGFLGLPDRGRPDFAPRRIGRGYRLGWLQRLLKRPPKATRTLLAGAQYRQRLRSLDSQRGDSPLVRAIFAGRKQLLNWNRAPQPGQRMPVALRREIRDRLAGEVDHLSRLIGRDLGHWLDGASTPETMLRPQEAIPDRRAPADRYAART